MLVLVLASVDPVSSTHAGQHDRRWRDGTVVALYATQGLLGYTLNGLGSALTPLRVQLQVSRTRVAFYSSLFALALLVVGVVGDRFTGKVGNWRALLLAVGCVGGGALLLAVPSPALSLVGAAVLGMGGALIIQVIPALLANHRPHHAGTSLAEANSVASAASIVAPWAVAGALAWGLGWPVGYVVPLVVAVLVLLVVLWNLGRRSEAVIADDRKMVGPIDGPIEKQTDLTIPDDPEPAPVAARAGLESGPMLGRWIDLVLAVGAEFCCVFWAAAALTEWHGASAPMASAALSAFLLGMALPRGAAGWITRGRHPLAVMLVACGVTLAGFALFWVGPALWVSVAGLLFIGTGLAMLFPLALTRLMATRPDQRDLTSSRGALASGIAIGGAPLLLARLADVAELRIAYLVVPALVLVLGLHVGLGYLRRPRQG